jgi:hypothetical protein
MVFPVGTAESHAPGHSSVTRISLRLSSSTSPHRNRLSRYRRQSLRASPRSQSRKCRLLSKRNSTETRARSAR